MSTRNVHYETALADFLRSRGVPYVAVHEARRSIFAGGKVKSFDFIVYPPGRGSWLVDVKGRKFPYTCNGTRRYWENWVTQADLDGLAEWQTVFGTGFEALLVFSYWLANDPTRWPTLAVHPYNGNYYAFYGVSVTAYRRHCQARSTRWKTVSVPVETFRQIAYPITERLGSA